MSDYVLTYDQFHAMHTARNDLHREMHMEAVKLPKGERKAAREFAKMASIMVRDMLNDELFLHVNLSKKAA